MTSRYVITRAAPGAVETDLVRLWRCNLHTVSDAHAKLRWTYHDAPEPPPRVYLVETRDRGSAPAVVGTAGVAVRRFMSPGGELRVALGCDLAVEREHRVLLPALRLVRQIRSDGRNEFDLIYNFPNEHARGLYARAGYHDLGTMTRHVRVLRAAPYLVRFLRSRRLARALGALVDLATRAQISLAKQVAADAFRLEWLEDVDDRFDALWNAARGAYPIVGRRDARWVRWRCLANPVWHGRVAALVHRDSGMLRAYAIVQRIDGVAHIRDLFGWPSDLDPLLALLLAALCDERATSVSFRHLGSAQVRGVLSEHGFRRRDANRHVYIAAGDTMTGSARIRVTDAESWHLTDYDEDC